MRNAPVPVRPGDVIDGKYRVESILGRGGMGTVVRAKHEALGRSVAIKLLLPDMLESTGMVQRFEREARAAARLKNDHVIDVLDVGRLATGEPFIVMELLEGKDLAAFLNERGAPLSVEETLEIMLQVCDAVGEAHAAGIVHRDLKPQNIFLTTRRDGRLHVKVLDFGISKIHGEVDGSLTSSQEMLGSPYYMSPEQLLSTRDAGPSADVWALGVILYQLLAARVPFEGKTLAAITNGICSHPHAPLATVRNDLPPWLVAIVEHCLRKDPVGRMRSVDALSEALRSRGQSATMPVFTPQDGVRHISSGSPKVSMPDAMVTAASTNVATPTIVEAPPTIVQPLVLPGASTNVGWGTSAQPKPSGGSTVWVVAGVVAILLFVGGGFAVRRFHGRAATPPPPSASAPVAAPPPVVTETSAPPSAVVTEPPLPPEPPASVSAKPPKPTRPKPTASTTGDDLPSLRK